MIIELPFGDQFQRFDTDDIRPPIKFGGRFRSDFPNPMAKTAISERINQDLKNLYHLFNQPKILTVVNDGYRRTPTPEILSSVWSYIGKGDFIVATGSHRKPTDTELNDIFGEFYTEVKPRLYIHDCYDNDSLIKLGVTSRGTPVSINKKASEADMILTINSVEPHFFAGFTGGRKSVVPGLASFETIQANHALAKDINSTSLNLSNNPLHLDLEEAVQFLGSKPILTIQSITDRSGAIIDLYAGDLRMAFYRACEAAQKYYTITIPKLYDIVIANCEPPLDINLYQLQKAQEHGALMVKKGGILIVVGACPEGVGSKYFMESADKYPTPEKALAEGINDNSFGMHKLIKTARQLQKFRIFYVTSLDDCEVRKVYFEPYNSLTKALKNAVERLGAKAELGILEDAGYMVPVIKS